MPAPAFLFTMNKLFVFLYDDWCDYSDIVLIVAKSEKRAREMFMKYRYNLYLKWVSESPVSGPYHVPYLTEEDFVSKDNAMCEKKTLDGYNVLFSCSVLLPEKIIRK